VRTDIGEILSEVKGQAHGGKDIAVEIKDAPLVVPVRRHAFKRAVANLINNAARFAAHVNVSAAKQNGALTVSVEDDGPGIPDTEHEHVFRPFYRLDHARNQDSGSTGLGLAIARDIARIHGGDIALSRSSLGGLKAVLKVPV
jgi:two-component system, OmpR family, osmolarity sensor histidine kinase EnvZ